jgi:PDZ domain-containing protein
MLATRLLRKAQGAVRRYKKELLAASVFVLMGMFLMYVQTPFYTVHPGPVVDLSEAVELEGSEAAEPGVHLLSVKAGRANVYAVFYAGLHPNIRVVHEHQLMPESMNLEEYLQYAKSQMSRAQAAAELVALQASGVNAAVEGGGLEVVDIDEGSPWTNRLHTGDRIVAANAVRTVFLEELAAQLRSKASGTLRVVRTGTPVQAAYSAVDLSSEARNLRRVLRGVLLENAPWSVSGSAEIEVDVGDIRGPSAGLALALEIYRQRNPGSWPSNMRVAATGTLDTAGNVGIVGGLRQKLSAAAEANIDVMVVPRGEPGLPSTVNNIAVLRVETFEEAVNKLSNLQRGRGACIDNPLQHAYNH